MSAQEKGPKKTSRINLVISPVLDDEFEHLSQQLDLTKVALARRLIKVALELHKAATDPERGVYFKEPGKEPERIRPFI